MTGVLEQEAARRAHWDALGLADPINVLAEERVSRLVYGIAVLSPRRAPLQAYFDAHPDEQPQGW